eukprot:s155_g17.t1
MQDRCLLWLRGNLVPFQSTANLQIVHGDYIRIATPPFENPSLPTHFAVRACQAGMSRPQLIDHFLQFGNDDESLHTAASNAQDANIIVNDNDEDTQNLLQTSFITIPPFLKDPTAGSVFEGASPQCSFTDEFIEAVRAANQAPPQDNLPEVPWDDIHSTIALRIPHLQLPLCVFVNALRPSVTVRS